MFSPQSLSDEHAKDDFAAPARLMCVAHAATACVMAVEAWAKFAKPGEKFDMTEAPSEAFDRREFVVHRHQCCFEARNVGVFKESVRILDPDQ